MYVRRVAARWNARIVMTSLRELPVFVQQLYPSDVRARWEIHEWRNATAIFTGIHRSEWADLMQVLSSFRLLRSEILRSGGNKSPIANRLDRPLYQLGWEKKEFDTKITVDDTVYESPTHEVDCFKNRIALEVEWNNKDPFYDRDLNNFRLLFELRAIDLGVIITRTDELQGIFNALGRGKSFGQATTHMSKLLPKIDGGGAGGCPVLVFGISPALYVEDETPVSPQELKEAELLEAAQEIEEKQEN
jgi:hypothetical protein